MSRCIICSQENNYICYWCLSKKIRDLEEKIRELEKQLNSTKSFGLNENATSPQLHLAQAP
ncbi:MAG: hypothetical protein ACXQTI_04880 [Candidatus Nezhaarchaeales archaeon]